MPRTLSEKELAKELGKPADRIRKWREKTPITGGTSGKPLELGAKEIFYILLSAELMRHSQARNDIREVTENLIHYDQVGKKQNFLYRAVKSVESAKHLTLTKWSVSMDLQELDLSKQFSVIVVNLEALKEMAKKIII